MSFTRRTDPTLAKEVQITSALPSVGATATFDLPYLVPSGRNLVVDSAALVPNTALAASDTLYVVITVIDSTTSNVAATWSTKLTGGNGAFVAGTMVAPVLSATVANLNIPGGHKMQVVLTVTGATTVPAFNLRLDARLQ